MSFALKTLGGCKEEVIKTGKLSKASEVCLVGGGAGIPSDLDSWGRIRIAEIICSVLFCG